MEQWLNLFGNLSKQDTEWLKVNGVELSINSGTTLVAADTNQSYVFFVLKGVFKVLPDAQTDLPIAILGPGEIIGESALLEKENSSATVIAVDKSVVLRLDKYTVKKQILDNPAFGLRLYKALYAITVERLRNTNRQLSGAFV